MTFNLDGARERMVGTGHAIIECVNAIWTYKYTNGYTITLRGPFTIHMVVTAMHPPTGNGAQPGYMLKIDEWQFSATHHDKMISLDSIAGPRNYEMPADMPRPVPTPPPGSTAATLWAEREAARQWDDPMVVVERATMPSEPINAFGIPQATMRCLELAESVGAMADLISFADETKLGPLAALTKFADILRSKGVILDRSENPRHTTGLVPLPPLPDLPIIYAAPNPPPPPSAQQQQMPQMGQQQPPQFTPPSNGIIPPPQQQHTPLSNTLYQSAPSSITNPQHHPLQSNGSQTTIPPPPGSATMSPQNTSSSASNSPQKSHRAIPNGTNNGSSGASGSSPAMSASGSTSHNTPNMANASLKRKQAGAEGAGSPVLANGEGPPTKRATRKRNRTNTAG
ncbi:hypothetical protein D9611_007588 [Ephemerocybe angulata]|uniref:Uncharacterized protein n=1 Tax=Ephemerocybe angulata TaxID=980116 RepID=A0A8H5FCT4_9AGAR|nr:hypothetical protein D9611_007588 [Tulosesus angulatus]